MNWQDGVVWFVLAYLYYRWRAKKRPVRGKIGYDELLEAVRSPRVRRPVHQIKAEVAPKWIRRDADGRICAHCRGECYGDMYQLCFNVGQTNKLEPSAIHLCASCNEIRESISTH